MIDPKNRDTNGAAEGFRNDRTAAAIVRSRNTGPQPPKTFKVEKFGTGVRISVTGTDPFKKTNGAVRYDIHWAEEVDASTTDGKDRGFARTKVVKTLIAPSVEDGEATDFLTDPQYQLGYFFCTGVAADGVTRSEYVGPQRVTDGGEGTIPGDVTHFQVSESGEEIHGTVYSVLSVSAVAPVPLGQFDGIELLMEDYPNPGDRESTDFIQYIGPPGGPIQKKVRKTTGRREGIVTASPGGVTTALGSIVVTGLNTRFLEQANAGDLLEIGGVLAPIAAVISDTELSLDATWGTYSSFAVSFMPQFYFVAQIRFRAVAIGRDGSRRSDIENAPYVDVIMDGDLSAPNAPASFTATAIGNFVRCEWVEVIGTGIKHYEIWRKEGSADTFSLAKLLTIVPKNQTIVDTTTTTLQYDDSDFTVYQRDTGAVFRYYVRAVNTRDNPGATATDTEPCRLNSYSDTDPTVPSRDLSKNRIYNGFVDGTAGNNVDSADVSQDAAMALGGPPTGWTRWHGVVENGHPTRPVHANGTEVKFPVAGASGQINKIYQQINGWDPALAPNRKMKKGAYVLFQCKARTATTGNNGTLALEIQLWDGGAYKAHCPYRRRISDDSWDEVGSTYTLACSSLLTTYSTVFAVFRLDETANGGVIDEVRPVIYVESCTSFDIYLTEIMLSEGDELTMWTHDMGDTGYDYPDATGPLPTYPEGDGHRIGQEFHEP